MPVKSVIFYRPFHSGTSVVVLIVLCFGDDFCTVCILYTFSYYLVVSI